MANSKEEATETELNVEATLAALRKTIDAFDNVERRWKEVQTKFAETLKVSLQSALGVEAPSSLSDEEKQAVLGGQVNIEEICKRLKGGQFRHIVVMVGAGISVSAGIPDFRSSGSGFYDKLDLKKYNLPTPQAMFDIEFFRKNPQPFFAVAKELYPGKYHPTPAHYFIKLLNDRGLLLRCYTQNIDGLEKQAGVEGEKLIEAHGSFSEAGCSNLACEVKANPDKVKSAIFNDQIPICGACNKGILKPNIVFFGEGLPERFKTLLDQDFSECDLLIVMGTSLAVQPFASLTYRVKQTTPRVLINRERVGTFTLADEGGYRDVAMLQDCDSAVSEICKLCDWSGQFEKLIQPDKQLKSSKHSHHGCH